MRKWIVERQWEVNADKAMTAVELTQGVPHEHIRVFEAGARRDSIAYMNGYKAANEEARKNWRAFVADNIWTEVDREAVTAHEIEAREAYRVIKWLIDHMDECLHTTLHQPGDQPNLLITTLDNVQEWLENMSGVLGANGYEADEEEGNDEQ